MKEEPSSSVDAFSSAWGESSSPEKDKSGKDKTGQERSDEIKSARSSSEYSSMKEALGEGVLKPGSPDNGAVSALQEALNEALGGSLEVDGDFGGATEDAVREFQEQNGLEVDGKVGDDTRAALLGPEPPRSRADLQDAEAARQHAAAQNPMIYGDMLSAEEQAKVREHAEELQTTPNDLMAVFEVETGGTFDPAERANGKADGAVGLIQFTGDAITDMNKRRAEQGLGPIDKEMLSQMTFSEQIDHARDYLRDTLKTRGVEGPVTREELYLAVFAPAAIDNADSDAIYSRPSENYSNNNSLDTDNDGHITREEIVARVNASHERGLEALAQ